MLQDPWDFCWFQFNFFRIQKPNLNTTSERQVWLLNLISGDSVLLSLRICFEEANAPESLVSTLVIKTMTFFFFFSRSFTFQRNHKIKKLMGFSQKARVLIQLQNNVCNTTALQLHFQSMDKVEFRILFSYPCGSRGGKGLI